MEKILLVGNFGAGNLGDEMILFCAFNMYQGADITVMSSNGTLDEVFCGQKLKTVSMPATGIRSLITQREKLEEHYDRIIFPGGGLWAIKLKASWIWSVVVWRLKKSYGEASFEFLHQGFDSTGIIGDWLMRKGLKGDNVITVRDKGSFDFLAKNNIKAKIVEDIVLENKLFLRGFSPQKERTKILINSRSALRSDFLQNIKVKFPGKEIVLIQMDSNDHGGKGVYPKTAKDLIDLYSSAEVVIGERLHSLILGSIFCEGNVFVIDEAYSKKVKSFVEEKGMGRFGRGD